MIGPREMCCLSIILLMLLNIQVISLKVDDLYVPEQCDKIAKPTDHVLFEYTILFHNGTEGPSVRSPEQLFHILIETSDDIPLHRGMKGMCENATRKLTWLDAGGVNLRPIYFVRNELKGKSISVELRVLRITDQSDFAIFDALKTKNFSLAMDMIDEQKGVNAVDEYGQTPLMLAVTKQYFPIISALLNARMPKVDVNMAKSSGFTALFYAVEKDLAILQALLRRGADPNANVLQEGSRGNTPLHFACMLEKLKSIELLLEYGANPLAVNQHGMTPLQLVPGDAVKSTKLYLKKLFQDAITKWQSSLPSNSPEAETQASNKQLPAFREL